MKHPSAAIFDQENCLVAYILQRPEGRLGCGYVTPEHRRKGFFKIVMYEGLKEMERRGETHGHADVTVNHQASWAAMLAIGGSIYEGYEGCWFEFIPETVANNAGV